LRDKAFIIKNTKDYIEFPTVFLYIRSWWEAFSATDVAFVYPRMIRREVGPSCRTIWILRSECNCPPTKRCWNCSVVVRFCCSLFSQDSVYLYIYIHEYIMIICTSTKLGNILYNDTIYYHVNCLIKYWRCYTIVLVYLKKKKHWFPFKTRTLSILRCSVVNIIFIRLKSQQCKLCTKSWIMLNTATSVRTLHVSKTTYYTKLCIYLRVRRKLYFSQQRCRPRNCNFQNRSPALFGLWACVYFLVLQLYDAHSCPVLTYLCTKISANTSSNFGAQMNI